MTCPPSPPNWRRRGIVVFTIAVLVLGLGWWSWPQGDQRIEGRWKASVAAEGPDFITFRPDGVATMEFGNGERLDFEWHQEANEVVIKDDRGREKRSQLRFDGPDRLEVGEVGHVGYTVLSRSHE